MRGVVEHDDVTAKSSAQRIRATDRHESCGAVSIHASLAMRLQTMSSDTEYNPGKENK